MARYNDPLDREEAVFRSQRDEMVSEQLEGRGISDPRVLEAMRRVPRHLFVRERIRYAAYDDRPLQIGAGQTISQPYMVALMVETLQLTGKERVLDVGTGSGYQAAVLAELASDVWSIEVIPELAERARSDLRLSGYANVHVVVGDGSVGLAEHAPYDGIVVAAGSPIVPSSLVAQLKEGGRLTIPIGDLDGQILERITKTRNGPVKEHFDPCMFVPLVGEEGWRFGEAARGPTLY
jgi:protein-L-isoaspartate(D-aspartate) O-methyltransferase